MEDRREEEQYRAQEAKKEDKKTSGGGPRLMDFLGRRKENDSKRAKDEARKEKEREDSSGKSVITEPPTTTTHTTSPSSVSIKGKDTVSGFTLKKIFGKKGENEDTVGEEYVAAQPLCSFPLMWRTISHTSAPVHLSFILVALLTQSCCCRIWEYDDDDIVNLTSESSCIHGITDPLHGTRRRVSTSSFDRNVIRRRYAY